MNRRLLARPGLCRTVRRGHNIWFWSRVHLRDTSLIPKGRSGQDGTFKCVDSSKKCGFMMNLQKDQFNEVLGRDEHGTVWEEL